MTFWLNFFAGSSYNPFHDSKLANKKLHLVIGKERKSVQITDAITKNANELAKRENNYCRYQSFNEVIFYLMEKALKETLQSNKSLVLL